MRDKFTVYMYCIRWIRTSILVKVHYYYDETCRRVYIHTVCAHHILCIYAYEHQKYICMHICDNLQNVLAVAYLQHTAHHLCAAANRILGRWRRRQRCTLGHKSKLTALTITQCNSAATHTHAHSCWKEHLLVQANPRIIINFLYKTKFVYARDLIYKSARSFVKENIHKKKKKLLFIQLNLLNLIY